MMWRRREVIFALNVEFNQQQVSRGQRLGGSNEYPERLESEMRDVVEKELPSDLKTIYDIDVRIRVITTRYGSLTVFFGAVLSGAALVASYKDFVESMHLIRQHCSQLAQRIVNMRYGGDWQVGVSIQHPRLPDPEDLVPFKWFRRRFPFPEAYPAPAFSEPPNGRRDAFFWFLVVTNMLLLGSVVALVWRAVSHTYFP